MMKVHIHQGDITSYCVDAIVNAANAELVMAGGVAGAIAQRGGPSIQDQCARQGKIPLGSAAITDGGDLPARYVIHQASMCMGGQTTEDTLRCSTQAVLTLAEQNGLHSLAFPATGTGIAGFPLERCARIMLEEVLRHLCSGANVHEVYFVLLDRRAYETFCRVFDELIKQRGHELCPKK